MRLEMSFRAWGIIIFALLVSTTGCSKKSDAPVQQEPPKEEVPAETEAQLAAAKEQSRANLLEIAKAYQAAEKAIGYLPIGMIDPNTGQLGLSWRVQILPYLSDPSAKELYQEFKLDEPWDSEHNKPLLAKMPTVFAPVRGKAPEGYTFYRGFSPSIGGDPKKRSPISIKNAPAWMLSFVLPDSDSTFILPKPSDKGTGKEIKMDWKGGLPLQGRNMQSIIDGSSTVVLAAEAADAVPWTKPEEIPVSFSISPTENRAKVTKIPALGGMFDGNFHMVMIHGEDYFVKKDAPRLQLGGFITLDDGEPPDFEALGLEAPQWVKDLRAKKPEPPKKPKVEPGPPDKDKSK